MNWRLFSSVFFLFGFFSLLPHLLFSLSLSLTHFLFFLLSSQYFTAASHGVRKGGDTDLQARFIGFSSPFFCLVVFVDFTILYIYRHKFWFFFSFFFPSSWCPFLCASCTWVAPLSVVESLLNLFYFLEKERNLTCINHSHQVPSDSNNYENKNEAIDCM